ncbi:hypothetical protein KQI84_06900 [bacterium]|nr:hypothetical protein [bacterium]
MKTRFFAACGLLLVLFWWFVLAFQSEYGDGARIQAAFRNRPDFGVEAAWKYIGPRPQEGEKLVIYGRQGLGDKGSRITLKAYLTNPGKPPPHTSVWKSASVQTPDIFTFSQLVLPDWPKGKDLYIGLSWNMHAPIWWERGPWPHGMLESKPFIREKTNARFTPGTRGDEFAGLDVRIIPESRIASQPDVDALPPASQGFTLPWTWLLVWAAMICAGLWRLPNYRTIWLVYNAFMGVLVLKAMEALLPNQYLWGGYFLQRTGERAFWIGLILLQVLSFPPLAPIWRRLSVRIWKFAYCIYRPWLLIGILPIIASIVCVAIWKFPVRMMYGDGFGALAIPGYDYHNPLAVALYRVFRAVEPMITTFVNAKLGTQFVLRPGYADMELLPYFLILFSPLFILGTWGIAWEIGRNLRERTMLWAILLSAKTLLLQFQYIEVYGPAVAITTVTVWLVLRAYLKHRDVVLCTVAAFFAYLFHMSFAPALPILALLWFRRAIAFRFHPGWWAPRLLAVAALAGFIWLNTLLVLFVMKHHYDVVAFGRAVPENGLAMLKGSTGLPHEQVFLQWSEVNYTHFYTLPTWEHFSQWAGSLIFLTGPGLFWLGLCAMRRIKTWGRTAIGWGFLIGAVAFLVASFFLATSFPNPKDWDVFSEAWVIWCVASLLFMTRLRTLPPHVTRWGLLALLMYQLWDTGLWLVYNLSWGPPVGQRIFLFY